MKVTEGQIRNTVFGFEDGFVSSVGALTGIAVASQDSSFVIVSGLVVIMVESFSMSVGSYLSEKSASELTPGNAKTKGVYVNAFLMGASYITAGSIVLAPFVIITSPLWATLVSVLSALTGLFILGYVKGKVVKRNPLRSACEMLLIAGSATGIGLVVGTLGKNILAGN